MAWLHPLQWRHNGHDDVSNHQPHHCLLNRLFKCRSKKTSKLCVTGLCAGNSPVTGEFPAQMANNEENVSIWWRHCNNVIWMHATCTSLQYPITVSKNQCLFTHSTSSVHTSYCKNGQSSTALFTLFIWIYMVADSSRKVCLEFTPFVQVIKISLGVRWHALSAHSTSLSCTFVECIAMYICSNEQVSKNAFHKTLGQTFVKT